MGGPIERAEHEEFRHRMEDEHKRLGKRLSVVEEDVRELHAIAVSIKQLANNMENMWRELTKQGERLDAIERRDGETWRQLKYHVITAAVSMAIGFMAKSLG